MTGSFLKNMFYAEICQLGANIGYLTWGPIGPWWLFGLFDLAVILKVGSTITLEHIYIQVQEQC